MGAVSLSQFKKKARSEGAIIVYEDEASFRQSPTLHQTWAPLNSQPRIPTRGERNTQKILGALALTDGQFAYRHQTEYFNTATYGQFLDEVGLPTFYRPGHRVYLIHDNASYHQHPDLQAWYRAQSKRLEVCPLPKYSPDFNAVERIWQFPRKEATHNRYFATVHELCSALFSVFADIQEQPDLVLGLLHPYF
jgi:transposase